MKNCPFNIHPLSKVINHPTEGLVVLPPPRSTAPSSQTPPGSVPLAGEDEERKSTTH